MSPKVSWYLLNTLNKNFKGNYSKVRPTLFQWQQMGYITLIEDDENIFEIYPEKLPSKEELLSSIV